jgi:predicted phage tail protein
MTLRVIHLHGRLKKQFGASHRFDVATAAEALRALNCAFPGDFVAALQTGSYKLVRGDKRSGMQLDLDLVSSFNLGQADLHLIPVAAGAANNKGAAKTIIGTVLIGAAIFASGGTLAAPIGALSGIPIVGGMTWGNIALLGLGVALSGVSTMLAGNTKQPEGQKNEDSFTINGPTNGARQGQGIPLIYGEVITGSVTVSFDADIEDIGAYQGVTGSMGSAIQAIKDAYGNTVIFGAPA